MRKFSYALFAALIIFVLMLACPPVSAETAGELFDKAMTLMFQGDVSTAKAIVEQNSAEHPDDPISYSAAAIYNAMGNIYRIKECTPEKAHEAVKKAIEKGPDSQWNHIALAILAAGEYMHGDLSAFVRIEKEARAARKLAPESGEPYFVLWFADKFFKHDLKTADKAYDAAIKYGSKYVELRYLLFIAESLLGDGCDMAVGEAVRAVEKSPSGRAKFIDWDGSGAGAISGISVESAARADCLMLKAMKSDFMHGAVEDQEKNLRAALAIAPGFYMASDRLETILTESGREGEAEAMLLKNQESNPGDISASYVLGRFYANKNDEKAIPILEGLLTRGVNKDQRDSIYEWLFKLYFDAGNFDRAIILGKEGMGVIELTFTMNIAQDLADLLFETGDRDGAYTVLNEAIAKYEKGDKSENNDWALGALNQRLAGYYDRDDKPDEAADAYEKVIQYSPKDMNIRSSLADALVKAGRPDEALDALDRGAAAFKPEEGNASAALKLHKAEILAAMGRADEADKTAAAAMASKPDDINIIIIGAFFYKRYFGTERATALLRDELAKSNIQPGDRDALTNALANATTSPDEIEKINLETISKVPNSDQAHSALWSLFNFYREAGLYSRADKTVEQLAAFEDKDTPSFFNVLDIGTYYYDRGRMKEASEWLSKLKEMDLNQNCCLLSLAFDAINAYSGTDAALKFGDGILARQGKKFRVANDVYESAGDILLGAGDVGKAKEYYSKIKAYWHWRPEEYELRMAFTESDFKKARELIGAAYKNQEANRLWALAASSVFDPAGGAYSPESEYRSNIPDNPNCAKNMFCAGAYKFYLLSGKYADAQKLAAVLVKDSRSAYENLLVYGPAFALAGDTDSLAALIAKAEDLQPNSIALSLSAGEALYHSGKREKAAKYFERVKTTLEKEGNTDEVDYLVASAYTGDTGAAAKIRERLNKYPGKNATLVSAALIFNLAGDKKETENCIRKLLSNGAFNSDSIHNASFAYAMKK